MHILIPPNIENGEPEIKTIDNKYQYKDKFIINNTLIDLKLNQITDTIKEADPPIMWQLYNITWIHYTPLPFLEHINSIVTIQKAGIGSKWFTTDEKNFINDSRNFFNIDEFTLHNKDN